MSIQRIMRDHRIYRGFTLARALSRKPNLSPDQSSSTAHILTSTSPAARPMSLTMFSERLVVTPELFFGHDTQSIPEALSRFAYSESLVFSSLSLLTNNCTKSSGLPERELMVTSLGRSSSFA